MSHKNSWCSANNRLSREQIVRNELEQRKAIVKARNKQTTGFTMMGFKPTGHHVENVYNPYDLRSHESTSFFKKMFGRRG